MLLQLFVRLLYFYRLHVFRYTQCEVESRILTPKKVMNIFALINPLPIIGNSIKACTKYQCLVLSPPYKCLWELTMHMSLVGKGLIQFSDHGYIP